VRCVDLVEVVLLDPGRVLFTRTKGTGVSWARPKLYHPLFSLTYYTTWTERISATDRATALKLTGIVVQVVYFNPTKSHAYCSKRWRDTLATISISIHKFYYILLDLCLSNKSNHLGHIRPSFALLLESFQERSWLSLDLDKCGSFVQHKSLHLLWEISEPVLCCEWGCELHLCHQCATLVEVNLWLPPFPKHSLGELFLAVWPVVWLIFNQTKTTSVCGLTLLVCLDLLGSRWPQGVVVSPLT
jgi:hypothetical protein